MRLRRAVIVLTASLLSAAALAQVERSGGGANAQLMQDYQQAVAQRTQFQAENDALKKQLEDLKKQLADSKQQFATTQKTAASTQAALAAAQSGREVADKNLADLKARTQELVERFRDTATTLKDVESDRNLLKQQLSQSKAEFDKCAIANDQLYQVDNEVLDRYTHQGLFSRVASAEPFTRLERTRIDNLAFEYRQRADELRVQRAPGAAPADAVKPVSAESSSAPR
jgi:chromosome segregation ATPase